MLMNLKAEMARHNVKVKEIAEVIGTKRPSTVYDKINGRYGFTFDEAYQIQQRFFPDQSLSYLFAREEVEEDDYCTNTC